MKKNILQKADVPWIHFLRVLACIMVVLLHTQPEINDCLDFDKVFYKIVGTLTRPCVPLFFMITGYLILPNREDNYMAFYKKRIPRVLFPLLIWGCIYAIAPMIEGVYGMRTMTIEILLSPIKAPEVMGGILWYLFVLIGIYLFIPFLSNRIYEDMRMMSIYLLFWLIASVIFFVKDKFNLVWGSHPWMPGPDLTLYFSGYLGYLLLGVSIKNGWIRSMSYMIHRRNGGGGMCVFSIYLIILLLAFQYHYYFYRFYSFGAIVMTFCLFMLIKDINIENEVLLFIIKYISKYSFGIYLCHVLLFNLLCKNIYYWLGSAWFIQLFVSCLTFLCALLLCRLIDLLPFKKYIIG